MSEANKILDKMIATLKKTPKSIEKHYGEYSPSEEVLRLAIEVHLLETGKI